MPSPFISREDLTDYLGRDVSDDYGALIAADAACDMVRALTEQSFNRGTSTVVLDGTGTDALPLPELPVNSAGTVEVSGTAVTDYVLKDNGLLIRKYPTSGVVDYWTETELPEVVWPAGRQNIEVTYVHGYADDDLPRDVRMVALSIASRLIVQGVAQQESLGEASVRYAVASTDLTAGEKAILRKYRR